MDKVEEPGQESEAELAESQAELAKLQAEVDALKKKDLTVHVDVGNKLADISFSDLPHELWPAYECTGQLATDLRDDAVLGSLDSLDIL